MAFRQTTEPLDPVAVLELIAAEYGVEVEAFRERRRDSPLRAIAIRFLIRFGGMSQRDVAAFLKIGSGSAVSKQLSRFAEGAAKSRAMQKQLSRIERKLVRVKEARASNR